MVRLTQLDGKMPNLALMKLAAYHRERGDEVVLSRNARRDMFEPEYDRVYGSVVFTRSASIVEHFKADFPNAIVGGTGLGDDWQTVEQLLGVDEFERYDYSIYPEYTASLGFTMRGCRLACAFCVVPRKEGRPRAINTIADIWRGEGHPKHICLLDNDFFGQPRAQWEARANELRDGGFKVCFNQGINVRLIDEQSAEVIGTLPYYDDSFTTRRIYTAWDNLKDGPIFTRGIELLQGAGVKPNQILVYMLVGFDPAETWERLWTRFNAMRALGVRPYPMVYQQVGTAKSGNDLDLRKLKDFQRWVIRRHYHVMPFEDYLKAPEGRRRDLHNESRLEFAL